MAKRKTKISIIAAVALVFALAMAFVLVPNSAPKAYADVTGDDVDQLVSDLQSLAGQKENAGDYAASSDLWTQWDDLQKTYADAGYEITDDVVTAYNTALAVYQQYSVASSHTHNYATVWSSDETSHWHACQNNDCDAPKGRIHMRRPPTPPPITPARCATTSMRRGEPHTTRRTRSWIFPR